MLTKRFMLTILLILIAVVASAQITVTSESVPAVGFSCWEYASAYNIAVDNGSAGANQVWTITNMSWPWSPAELSFVTPSTTPAASSFPTATHCTLLSVQNHDEYSYYRVTSTGDYFLGFHPTIADPSVFIAPGLLLALPLSYPHDSWTEVEAQDIVPDRQVDSTIHSVDGWGTINTSIGSAQVIRVYNRHFNKTLSGTQVIDSSRGVSYSWIDQRGLEVVRIAAPVDTVNPNFSTGSIQITGLGTISADPPRGPVARNFSVGQNYPNPFNPTTTLPIDLEKSSHVSMDIYDETGRLVSHTEHDLTAGTHEMVVDGSAWASGSYFARVSAQDQSQTVKMQMVK